MAKRSVQIAFQKSEFLIPLELIVVQREINSDYRNGAKYRQIAQSMEAVGMIEALVVYPQGPASYLLLDGHSRLDVLQRSGAKEARCILSTDDESYTFNKRVNHVNPVMQHFMINRALQSGISEDRLAHVLSLKVENIRKKRNLLDGICPEAVHLLRHRRVATEVFAVMKKMKPVRQVEAAEHMIAGSTYSAAFAKSLLAVTKPEMLIGTPKRVKLSAESSAAQEMLGRETEQLIRDLKAIENSYGSDVLTLTICSGYVKRMLTNQRVERHLSRNHADVLGALKKAVDSTDL